MRHDAFIMNIKLNCEGGAQQTRNIYEGKTFPMQLNERKVGLQLNWFKGPLKQCSFNLTPVLLCSMQNRTVL